MVIERFVTGSSGEIQRTVAGQQFARESVDIDQFVVAPARRDGLQATEAQAPG
jgi:hypothetical protein